MKLRALSICNFRQIEKLDWSPAAPLVCILGVGDSGKSTVLDAIEAALSPRRTQFFDTDFPNSDTQKQIEIIATVGELPQEVFDENRMGLFLRGLSKAGEVHDEPLTDDEPVLTVRLSVNDTLEPAWELTTERGQIKPLSSRDRAYFGVARLTADTDAHFAWGQYSLLTRLSSARGDAASILTEAYRQARVLINTNPLVDLNAAAARVRTAAVEFGAYVPAELLAGLDTQRSSTSLAALTLHALGVPVRLAGLGTRRLTALAVQHLAISEGAIVLVDELEHGLEPHRIRHALKLLREKVDAPGGGSGQVILTTHSSVTVVELAAQHLAVIRRTGDHHELRSLSPDLQDLIRDNPEALLGKRILVCEGKTEIGLIRGLRSFWATRHQNESVECRGVVLANAGGSSGPVRAARLRRLGYEVGLFRDSDCPLSPQARTELTQLGIPIFEWSNEQSTEDQFFKEFSPAAVQALLEVAYENWGEERIRQSLSSELGVLLPGGFEQWLVPGKTDVDVRGALGSAAKGRILKNGKRDRGWFKRIDLGEALAEPLVSELSQGRCPEAARTLAAIEAWSYAQ